MPPGDVRGLLTVAESRALSRFESVKGPLRFTSDTAAEEVRSCVGCGMCCEHPRNEMKASPLEALAVAVRLLEDPLLSPRLDEMQARIDAAVERYGLREVEDDGRTYTCPMLEPDKSCLVHGAGQPLGCVVFVPLTRERCDFRWDDLEAAGVSVGAINDELYGEDTWPVFALPVALGRALADLRLRAEAVS